MPRRSIALRALLTLILLPLVYLSGVRLLSQIVIPTDFSSLWATPSPAIYYEPKVLISRLKLLTILDPLSADYGFLLAGSLVGANAQGAKNKVQRAIWTSVASPDGWILQGTLSGRTNQFDAGVAAFEKALFLNPSRAKTYLAAGLYLYDALPSVALDRGPLYRTLAELNLIRSLNLDPSLAGNPRVCLAMAEIMAEKSDRSSAIVWLKRTPLQYPVDWAFAVRKMAVSFTLGEGVEARALWRKVFVTDMISEMQLGIIEAELKKYAVPELRYFLSQVHIAQNKPELAEKELVSLTATKSAVADYWIALGTVHERLHHSGEARLCYVKALQLSPSNDEAKKKLVGYYTQQ